MLSIIESINANEGEGPVPASTSRSRVAAAPSTRLLTLFDGHRLTPTQRRLAQCLVEHAAEAAFLSSSELADLAKVSQPSVTRFAVALGYSGYPELRRTVRSVVAGQQVESPDEARRNEWQSAVAAEVTNLTSLADALADPAAIERAGELLMTSRPLVVVGVRAAAPLAAYFGYFAAKVHPALRVIDTGGSLLADRLEQAWAAGATTVLAFVLPRYPREALEALDTARALGFTVITVTDAHLSPAAAHSDHVLCAAVGSRLVFDSHAGPMVLSSLLLQAMCDAAPAESQARLEEFERSAAERALFAP